MAHAACGIVFPVFIMNPADKLLRLRIKQHLRPYQIHFAAVFVQELQVGADSYRGSRD